MTILSSAFRNVSMAMCTMVAIDGMAQQPTIFLADPTIFQDKGTYYLYGTGHDHGFPVYLSHDGKTWHLPADSTQRLALRQGEAYGTTGFWAPQIVAYKGSYYMAYTANEQIAIAKAASPAGPFKQATLTALSGSGRQIDPFLYFDESGKVYLFHVKLQNGNRIFVSEMKPDLSDVIPGTEKECIASAEGWENTAKADWPVAEGPTVLKRDGVYYLIYSANDFRNKDYAVGYATAESPLGPWKKYAGNPIISRKNFGYAGTGHGDVFFDPKGGMHYVLHTHRSDNKVSPRATGVVDLRFKPVKGGPAVLEAVTGSFTWLSVK